jgi:class 3 adenylate cyclase
MLTFDRLSIRSKLILFLLATSACAILVVGYLGYASGKEALTESSFNHLTSLRVAKAEEIRLYFMQIRGHLQALSEDRMVIEAAQSFRAAFQELRGRPIPPAWDERLTTYYREEFLRRLASNVEGEPVLEAYKPTEPVSSHLQYHYLAANPQPTSKKGLLDRADDGTRYSEAHQRFHPALHALVSRMGYYDLFLIDADTGDVLYTAQKETDFATNLDTGPYRESNLARLVKQIREEPDRGSVKLADFRAYRPSYGAPAAFMATPLYEGAKLVAVLALQLSTEEINDVMTSRRNWKANGLGDTGETYLVGSDLRMRSSSRFQIEDPEGYALMLRNLGTSEHVVQAITHFKTSILLQEVETEGVHEALRGQEGTRVIRDYRGMEVLSSFAPLRIDGLDWCIFAEMDLDEVNRPVEAFALRVLISSVILVVVLTLLALYLTHVFVRPFRVLIAAARQVGEGRHDVKVDIPAQDEVGELAHAFNTMVQGIHRQARSIEQQRLENEALLLNIMPDPMARRFKGGERPIVSSTPQATVLVASVSGFNVLSEQWTPAETAELLGQLIDAFSEAAERQGVEWIETLGESYMAVCGITVPRLDHTRRVADLALEMQATLQRVNLTRGTNLSLRAGIEAGAVTVGVVGSRRLLFDLWGQSVSTAQRLDSEAPPGTIHVSQGVHDRLQDSHELEAAGAIWVLQARRAPMAARERKVGS